MINKKFFPDPFFADDPMIPAATVVLYLQRTLSNLFSYRHFSGTIRIKQA